MINCNETDNYNKQIFHAFLFNIKNYSHEVINIQRREADLNIILPRVNFGQNTSFFCKNCTTTYLTTTPSK